MIEHEILAHDAIHTYKEWPACTFFVRRVNDGWYKHPDEQYLHSHLELRFITTDKKQVSGGFTFVDTDSDVGKSDWFRDHWLILDEENTDPELLDYWANDGYSEYHVYPDYEETVVKRIYNYNGNHQYIGNNPSIPLEYNPPSEAELQQQLNKFLDGMPSPGDIRSVQEAEKYAPYNDIIREDLEWWQWFQQEYDDRLDGKIPCKNVNGFYYGVLHKRRKALINMGREVPSYYDR